MIYLKKNTVDSVLGWACRHPQVEVCGVVTAGLAGEVVMPLRNMSSDPAHFYEVNAAELVKLFDRMDEMGNAPVAFYHSHPEGSSVPSEIDMRAAWNTGVHYLIAYPDTSELKSWGSLDPIATVSEWHLSAWECLEPGVLVEAKLETRP